MARWTASAKWAEGPALDGQRDTPLGLGLNEGLGITVGGNGKVRSVPPVLLTLENQNESNPLRADQADRTRSCLPPRTKLNEATALRRATGPQELTDKPCSGGHSCLPRSADLKLRKVELLLHERCTPLRSVFLSAAVQVNEWRRLLAAMPRRGCLILGAARRTFCRRRHELHFVMPNLF